MIFLNVGQGDSILIKTSNNKFGLIDAGPNKNVLYQIEEFLPIFVKDIEFVVLTHPDKDHIEGIIYILDRYNIKKVFINKFMDKTDLFKYFKNKLSQRNIDTYYLTTNNDFRFGEFYFDVLWPQNYFNPNLSTNNSSISFKIEMNNYVIYSFGDLESEFEIKALNNINSQINLSKKTSILKISHHGSKYSTSQELINYINPAFTIISVGRGNSYGHPSEEVINLLKKNNVNIYRTDMHNSVILNFSSN
jgi:competence protein ComEC